jgi:HD-like signal output (HDOD) protein
MNTIEAILQQVEALPSSPQILPKLLGLLKDPDTDVSLVADLIAYDPGLTARVLKLCNSAALGGANPVADIPEAVNRVGMDSVYRIVAAATGRAALQPRRSVPGLDPQVLWKHSVTAALAAQIMAEDQRDDVSAVFTLSLLHDAGMIVMGEAFPERYGRLLASRADAPAGLAERERAEFGIDHAEVGGRLLGHWKFPATLTAAIVFQNSPKSAGPDMRFAAYVHLADVLANLLVQPSPALNGRAPATSDALNILGLTDESLAGYRERTLENFEFVNALCRG